MLYIPIDYAVLLVALAVSLAMGVAAAAFMLGNQIRTPRLH